MSRSRLFLSAVVAALAAATLFGSAAPAAAAPGALSFTSGGCVINRVSDGPVASGSQCAGADLSGQKLAQSALDGADLTGADLSGADIQASSLKGATLTGADFTGARIVGADFTGAGVVPATLDVAATTDQGAPVTFEPTLPEGLSLTGCTIVGEPVASGAVFPLGVTGVVCSFASSRPNEVATAVVQVTVSSAVASAPPVPVFSAAPSGTASAPVSGRLDPQLMLVLLVSAAGVMLLGIVGLVVARARRRPRTVGPRETSAVPEERRSDHRRPY